MSTSSPQPPSSRTVAIIASLATLALPIALVVWWSSEPPLTIGVEGRRVVEIAGPPLTAAAFTPGDALAVRIADSVPIAGGRRYDLRFTVFGPGEHDLAGALRRPDGSNPPTGDKLRISVEPLIPEDYSGILFDTATSPVDLHSRYSFWMTAAWVLWLALVVPLVWFGHKRRRAVAPPPPPSSIVERLRTLLRQAADANLSVEEQADLEQLLLAFWSRRLNLSADSLSEAVEQLRRHPQAGAQWNRVERWLHSRDNAAGGATARQLLTEFENVN